MYFSNLDPIFFSNVWTFYFLNLTAAAAAAAKLLQSCLTLCYLIVH